MVISTNGRNCGSDDGHCATSSADDNGGKLCNAQSLRASPHFDLRPLQDRLVQLARFQLTTSPSLSR